MTWLGRRETTALLSILLAAGCAQPATVSGPPPERTTRDLPHDGIVAAPKNRMALYKHKQNEELTGAPKVEKVDVTQARVGIAATHRFHRPDCALMKGVPATEQVRFTSMWEALDADYQPCDVCKSAAH